MEPDRRTPSAPGSYFVIEHPARGVYVNMVPSRIVGRPDAPSFSWKRAYAGGRHFATRIAAQAFLDRNLTKRCQVLEKAE